MSRLCAEDVARLARAIKAIEVWNATGQKRLYLSMDGPFGPPAAWNVEICSGIETEYYGEGETLGDAIVAAMTAWKEARDDR